MRVRDSLAQAIAGQRGAGHPRAWRVGRQLAQDSARNGRPRSSCVTPSGDLVVTVEWAKAPKFRVLCASCGGTPVARGLIMMAPLAPSAAAVFSLPATVTRDSAGTTGVSWWRSSVSAHVAAGALGAAILACAATIEVARAWTSAPRPGAEAAHVVGGLLVALFVVAASAFAIQMRSMSTLVVATAFALFAHGGTLVLSGETIGAIFLGVAPIVAGLSKVAFAPPAETNAVAGARLLALFMKTTRKRPALTAPRHEQQAAA